MIKKALTLFFLVSIACSLFAQDYSSESSSPSPKLYVSKVKHKTSKGPKQSEALTDLLNRGFEHLYNFEFTKADSVIEKAKISYPNQPLVHLLAANYYWWMLISGEDNTINRLKFRQSLDLSKELLGSTDLDSLNNDEVFIMINTYLFKSRLELKEKNYVKSVYYLNDCISYLKYSFGKEEQYEPFYVTTGMYNYFWEYGVHNYPILYPSLLFFPKGEMKTGLEQLEKASKSKEMLLSNEGNYFLLKIYLEMEKDPEKATPYAELLISRHPTNLVYQYLLFKSLIQSNDYAEARKQLEKINLEAMKNTKLTPSQKNHFLDLAKQDLKSYFARNK